MNIKTKSMCSFLIASAMTFSLCATTICTNKVLAKDNVSISQVEKKCINEYIDSCYDILSKTKFDADVLVAAKAIGKDIPKNFLDELNNEIQSGNFNPNYIMALAALGMDPSNVKGRNLVSELYNIDLSKNNQIYFLNSYLKVLNSGKFNVPDSHKFTKKDLINNILKIQLEKGGWGFDGKNADADSTTMTVTALSSNKEDKDVKETIDKCVKLINDLRNEKGEYTTNWCKDGSSESFAQAIIALCSLGIDAKDPKFVKGGKDLVDGLLAYATKDGGFAHDKSDLNKYNDYATQQAFVALAAYKNFKEGKDFIYNTGFKSKDTIKIEKPDFKIENMTNVKEFKLGTQAKVTIKATNISKENKEATLVLGLFDEDNKLVNYGAVDEEIKAKDSVKLNVMLAIPNKGQYKVKAFVWDSLEGMKPLSDAIEIPVL